MAQNTDSLTPFALFGWSEGLGVLLLGATQFLLLGVLLVRSMRRQA